MQFGIYVFAINSNGSGRYLENPPNGIGRLSFQRKFNDFTLYVSLDRLDKRLLEASSKLGAKPWRTFVQITLPLSIPGIAAGCMLVSILLMGGRPALGSYVKQNIPMGRWATTDEISDGIVSLAPDLPSFMTGHALVVDSSECI